MNILDKVKSFFGFLSLDSASSTVVERVEEELISNVEKEASAGEAGLESMTVAQLRSKAKSLGMKGYTGLRKSDLVERVKQNL